MYTKEQDMKLTTMLCKSVQVHTIQGIVLVDFTFVSLNGIEAHVRAQTDTQYIIGAKYQGKLAYLPRTYLRYFSNIRNVA